MMRMRTWVVLALALGASGCDDGNDAPVKCDQLLELSCTRAVQCGTQPNQADCLTEARILIDCSMAKTAKTGFDTCMSDLRAMTCDDLMKSGLPDSCDTVILF